MRLTPCVDTILLDTVSCKFAQKQDTMFSRKTLPTAFAGFTVDAAEGH